MISFFFAEGVSEDIDGDGGDAEKSPPLFFAPKLQPFLDCIRQNIAELKLQICGGFFSFRIKARKRE